MARAVLIGDGAGAGDDADSVDKGVDDAPPPQAVIPTMSVAATTAVT
ncbi:hypothetical protein [Arthrobacter sp. AL12]|nr:hypothetical protein [Arthrobacter sp. AL12]MDI3213210.1 hypothetical protein [Arthrobacter sp. AL12]